MYRAGSHRSAWHARIGEALAPLRQRNVLIVGSGSISHNLGEVFRPAPAGERDWAENFTSWLADRAAAGDRDALLGTMQLAPDAARNYPTDEHLLPFFVALGAGGDAPGRRIHHSYTYEVLAMDIYAFGEVDLLNRNGKAGSAAAPDEAIRSGVAHSALAARLRPTR